MILRCTELQLCLTQHHQSWKTPDREQLLSLWQNTLLLPSLGVRYTQRQNALPLPLLLGVRHTWYQNFLQWNIPWSTAQKDILCNICASHPLQTEKVPRFIVLSSSGEVLSPLQPPTLLLTTDPVSTEAFHVIEVHGTSLINVSCWSLQANGGPCGSITPYRRRSE